MVLRYYLTKNVFKEASRNFPEEVFSKCILFPKIEIIADSKFNPFKLQKKSDY